MNEMEENKDQETGAIPTKMRSRLGELARKLESERRQLDEARLLSESQLKALNAEMDGREVSWRDEKSDLERTITDLQEQCKKWETRHTDWDSAEERYRKQIIQLEERANASSERERKLEGERRNLADKVEQLEKDMERLKENQRQENKNLADKHEAELNEQLDELEGLLGKARKLGGEEPSSPAKGGEVDR